MALKTDRFLYTMLDESGDIFAEQKNDHFVSHVRDLLFKSKSPKGSPGYNAKVANVAGNCFLDNGVVWYNLFKQGGIGYPVVLCPDSMKHMVMDAAHCSPFAGHSGKQRAVDRIELGYWWPGLTYDVQNFLHKCPVCQELQGWKPIPSPLNPLPTVAEPNMWVHMDLFGPLKVRSANWKKYIMFMTDAFSKYTELAAICDKKAETVAKVFFEHWICRHGVPAVIVSDRGKEFLNDTMKKLCEFMGMDHNPTSSYHPQSNAQAETYNKTMIRYLSCMLDNNTTLDWEEMLPAMMMAYNCHVHRVTKESPFFLTYLHNPRLPYFNLDKPQPLYGQTYVNEAFKTLQVSYQYAKDNMKLAEEARTEYFNRSVEERSFKLGDKVLVKFPMVPKGVNPKFFKKWQGNFTVVKRIGNLNLLVACGLS